MEIKPMDAHLVRRLKDGRVVEISDDVMGVAAALQRIDPNFYLRYVEEVGRYVVYHANPDPPFDETIIVSAPELDHRVAEEVARVAHRCRQPGYSYADDLEARDRQREREIEAQRQEQAGIFGERLAYALRKDLKKAEPGSVYIPPDIYPG